MFYVIANDADSETKNAAALVINAGYPVWQCDGTADDVQIQAAIDALPAGGGKIILSEGTFYISTCIIPVNGLSLEGQGGSTTLKSTATGGGYDKSIISNISVKPNSNIVIRDLVLDGDKNNVISPAIDRSCIELREVTGLLIENIEAKNSVDFGIDIYDSSDIILRNSKIHDNGLASVCSFGGSNGYNIRFGGNTRYTVDNVEIYEAYNAGFLDGTGISGGYPSYGTLSNIKIWNNVINIDFEIGNTQAIYYILKGIHSWNAGKGTSGYGGYGSYGSSNGIEVIGSYVTISDCIVHDCKHWGLQTSGSQYQIIGNKVFLNDEDGMYLTDGTECLCNSNLVWNNNTTGGSTAGITLLRLTRVMVKGNMVWETRGAGYQDDGIRELETTDYSVIVDNKVWGNNGNQIEPLGANSIIRDNLGYVTENSGVASNVTLDASGVGVIAHGCDATPTVANVQCQSANLNVRISSIDATNINIVVYDLDNAVVTADTHDFYWEAK